MARLTKAMRLRARREFLAVQDRGRKLHGRHFFFMFEPTAGPEGRVGITVTKKVGNAVVRNRIRRWVREWLRTHGWVPSGRDVVVVARNSAANLRGLDEVGLDLAPLQRQLA